MKEKWEWGSGRVIRYRSKSFEIEIDVESLSPKTLNPSDVRCYLTDECWISIPVLRWRGKLRDALKSIRADEVANEIEDIPPEEIP